MEMNRKLNLVLPVDCVDGVKGYIHATPIGYQTFKDNYLVIAKTFSAIYSEGLHIVGGPKVSALLMRDVAKQLDVSEQVEKTLFAEIRRLANLVRADSPDTVPFEEAVKRGVLDEEGVEEVEGLLCFFTVASSMHNKKERAQVLASMAGLYGGLITSQPLTEYKTSLPTSTQAESIGETVNLSSIPH